MPNFFNRIYINILILKFSVSKFESLISKTVAWPYLVHVGKMFCLETTRMELKCHLYDVTDAYVFNVFYNTKTTSDTVTDCNVKCRAIVDFFN